MLRKLRSNQGFTLIELMIVIAIIGILAAIAIPNFISYRDKAYCSAAESDAQTIGGAIADYFSDPSNRTVTETNLALSGGFVAPEDNDWDVTEDGNAIAITITDASDRCPRFSDYSIRI